MSDAQFDLMVRHAHLATASDSFDTGIRAAARGGTTMVIPFDAPAEGRRPHRTALSRALAARAGGARSDAPGHHPGRVGERAGVDRAIGSDGVWDVAFHPRPGRGRFLPCGAPTLVPRRR